MKKTLTAVALTAALALAGCSGPATPQATTGAAGGGAPAASAPAQKGDLLATYGLTGLSGKEIVEKIDQDDTKRPLAMRASVRYDHVIIGDGQTQTEVPIQADDNGFYLSIAPYAAKTHECHFHSLATCQGEMVGKPVQVKITDSTGKVLVDEQATTYANGFVGFWLPRDITGTVEVTVDSKTGTVPFATGPQDATCLTTLQVS